MSKPMKYSSLYKIGLMLVVYLSSYFAMAQRSGGWDPNEMIAREKQNLYTELTDLSKDQKMLIDGIYDEYSLSFTELREEVRQSGNYQTMRPKMEALTKEKDELMRDVLNDEQYAVYENIINDRRQRMQQNRPARADSLKTKPNQK